MKEIKDLYLKVDQIEPMYKCECFSREMTLLDGIRVWIGNDGHKFECDQFTVCDPEVIIESSKKEAQVETLKMLQDICDEMPYFYRERSYGKGNTAMIDIIRLPYDKIAEGYNSWKKEKEDEEKKIRVRDEVCHQTMQVKFVVTKIIIPSGGEDAIVNGIKKDGTAIKSLLLHDVKKTGLHVDDLDAYLEV